MNAPGPPPTIPIRNLRCSVILSLSLQRVPQVRRVSDFAPNSGAHSLVLTGPPLVPGARVRSLPCSLVPLFPAFSWFTPLAMKPPSTAITSPVTKAERFRSQKDRRPNDFLRICQNGASACASGSLRRALFPSPAASLISLGNTPGGDRIHIHARFEPARQPASSSARQRRSCWPRRAPRDKTP